MTKTYSIIIYFIISFDFIITFIVMKYLSFYPCMIITFILTAITLYLIERFIEIIFIKQFIKKELINVEEIEELYNDIELTYKKCAKCGCFLIKNENGKIYCDNKRCK